MIQSKPRAMRTHSKSKHFESKKNVDCLFCKSTTSCAVTLIGSASEYKVGYPSMEPALVSLRNFVLRSPPVVNCQLQELSWRSPSHTAQRPCWTRGCERGIQDLRCLTTSRSVGTLYFLFYDHTCACGN
jgi:hypothetical protein